MMATMPITARMMTSGFLLVDAPLGTLAELTVSS
jgi:hypothetical protein